MITGPPPEWQRMEDEDGVPSWQHHKEPVRVTTWDWDLLLQLDMFLIRYAEIGSGAAASPVFPAPPPGEDCYWTTFRNSA